jgi:hypothetical protein
MSKKENPTYTRSQGTCAGKAVRRSLVCYFVAARIVTVPTPAPVAADGNKKRQQCTYARPAKK